METKNTKLQGEGAREAVHRFALFYPVFLAPPPRFFTLGSDAPRSQFFERASQQKNPRSQLEWSNWERESSVGDRGL